MTLFEQVIARTHIWLEALDRERDAAARAIASVGTSADLEAWLCDLDDERLGVIDLIVELRRLEAKNTPALLFYERPLRQLKAGLNPHRKRGAA